MRYALFIIIALWPLPTVSAERQLTGAEIQAWLPTIVALGDNTRQTFSAAGATTYTINGRDSYGSWRVDGERYCSQWPPARDWSCYGVVRFGKKGLVWVAPNGQRTVNSVANKN